MGGEVRLVQRSGVEDRLHAGHVTPDARAVGYGADASREWSLEDIEADDLAPRVPQGADQRLAQVTGASCDQDSHARRFRSHRSGSAARYSRNVPSPLKRAPMNELTGCEVGSLILGRRPA
jgi:hypothetical protein